MDVVHQDDSVQACYGRTEEMTCVIKGDSPDETHKNECIVSFDWPIRYNGPTDWPRLGCKRRLPHELSDILPGGKSLAQR